jgi:hypothetical protein
MDLTPASQARLWDVFQKLHHRLRVTKEISWNECIREAYITCVGEGLSHELSVARVTNWGRRLGWLEVRRLIRPGISGYFSITERTPAPEKAAVFKYFSEDEHREAVAAVVADLIPAETPPLVALLDRVVRAQSATQELWAKNHHIGWTSLKCWKAAGGKPVEGKVSQAMADKIEAVIRQDAAHLGF